MTLKFLKPRGCDGWIDGYRKPGPGAPASSGVSASCSPQGPGDVFRVRAPVYSAIYASEESEVNFGQDRLSHSVAEPNPELIVTG